MGDEGGEGGAGILPAGGVGEVMREWALNTNGHELGMGTNGEGGMGNGGWGEGRREWLGAGDDSGSEGLVF